jgi:putative membrane protein
MSLKKFVYASALLAALGSTSFALAQTASQKPADKAPAAGANSFTESQARSRIESAGYSRVTNLKKDDQGIWRGTATRDGKQVPVALDFRGNVVTK